MPTLNHKDGASCQRYRRGRVDIEGVTWLHAPFRPRHVSSNEGCWFKSQKQVRICAPPFPSMLSSTSPPLRFPPSPPATAAPARLCKESSSQLGAAEVTGDILLPAWSPQVFTINPEADAGMGSLPTVAATACSWSWVSTLLAILCSWGWLSSTIAFSVGLKMAEEANMGLADCAAMQPQVSVWGGWLWILASVSDTLLLPLLLHFLLSS